MLRMRWSQASARSACPAAVASSRNLFSTWTSLIGFLGAPMASDLKRSMVLPPFVLIRTRAHSGPISPALDFAVKSGS